MSQNVDGRNMDVITHLATVTLVYLMTNIGWARLLARGQLWNDLPMS